MKKIGKIFALLLAVLMMAGVLSACGGSDAPSSADTEAPEITTTEATETTEPVAAAEVVTWGDWTVEAPAGFRLKGGDFLDENDSRYFSLQKSDFYYFDFKADGETYIMSNYNYNKNTYTNEQVDVEGSFGGNKWTGFQYSDGFGGYGFEAYTTVDGEMIRVSGVGFAFDDAVTSAVLSSLQYTPAADTEPAEVVAPPEEETTEEPTEGAPVYAKVIELKDATVGIGEGYSEVLDETPTRYVMSNTTTGGRVNIRNANSDAESEIAKILSGLDYELREEDINGMHWYIGVDESFYCFGTNIGDDVLVISIDYGATDEEMEALIFGVTLK